MRYEIYSLTDPNTNQVRYVGLTTTGLQKRLAKHLLPYRLKDGSHKSRWILSLKEKGQAPEIHLLQACASREEMYEAEKAFIRLYTELGQPLTNKTLGGQGASGAKWSEDTNRKRRLTLGGLTDEQEIQAIEAYNAGASLAEVGKAFGVSDRAIARIMERHGIPRRSLSFAMKLARSVDTKYRKK